MLKMSLTACQGCASIGKIREMVYCCELDELIPILGIEVHWIDGMRPCRKLDVPDLVCEKIKEICDGIATLIIDDYDYRFYAGTNALIEL